MTTAMCVQIQTVHRKPNAGVHRPEVRVIGYYLNKECANHYSMYLHRSSRRIRSPSRLIQGPMAQVRCTFAEKHNNRCIDPLLLMAQCGPRLDFTTAPRSMQQSVSRIRSEAADRFCSSQCGNELPVDLVVRQLGGEELNTSSSNSLIGGELVPASVANLAAKTCSPQPSFTLHAVAARRRRRAVAACRACQNRPSAPRFGR
jgi:hypothetical protein